MNRFCKNILALSLMLVSLSAYAQVDKKEVRKGNRDFRKENYKEAEIDYRKALVKDSLSVAANYNLANTLYKQQDYDNAAVCLDRIKESAPATEHSADYFYNLGDVALAKKDYKSAVQAFMASLLLRPEDLDAKENYIYARKMLENQQQNGGGGNDQNDQNQNKDQNQDQNKDQNQDQNKDQNQDQNKDQNQDQNKDQNQDQDNQNKDQNKDQQNPNQDQQNPNNNQSPQNQPEQNKISPQAAQQMLQAIQAKEKETQDKVKKEKAALLQSRQREKNW